MKIASLRPLKFSANPFVDEWLMLKVDELKSVGLKGPSQRLSHPSEVEMGNNTCSCLVCTYDERYPGGQDPDNLRPVDYQDVIEDLHILNWHMHVIQRQSVIEVEAELKAWIDTHHNGLSKDYNRSPDSVYRDIRSMVQDFDPSDPVPSQGAGSRALGNKGR
jgi:hypothetical protein